MVMHLAIVHAVLPWVYIGFCSKFVFDINLIYLFFNSCYCCCGFDYYIFGFSGNNRRKYTK